MPKSTDKKKGAQTKRKASSSSCVDKTRNAAAGNNAPKKRKIQKQTDYKNEIAKSKQLASKRCNPRSRSANSSKITEPRLCGNGIPMPSLADLERMFEDSDSDEEPTPTAKTNTSDRPETPTIPIPVIEDKLVSPKTIKNITSKLMDMISNNDIISIIDDVAPPPVIPQKKRKKSDIPYIVGCKERPQVPWQPKTSFCKGDEDYGVDKNAADSDEDENSCPKKRRRGTKVNLSKSIFNAQSDEIAERLKKTEHLEGQLNSSPESNNTEPYDYTDNSNYMTKHFEPLASTSTDRVTIDINDRLFNQSFNLTTNEASNNTQDQLEVIEIDDTMCSKDENKNNQSESHTVVDDDSCIIIGAEIKKERQNNNETSVDCCLIIDSDSEGTKENKQSIETIIGDNLPNYDISTIDLTNNQEIDMNEIIDIDSIIAENEATINKYRGTTSLDTVTLVEPSNSNNSNSHEETVTNRNSNPSSNTETDLQQSRSVQESTPNVEQNQNLPESISVSLNGTGNNAERIANVVADFFNLPESERNNPDRIVDLTGSPARVINKITSWISKIQSFINGHRNSSQDQRNNDIIIVDESASTSSDNVEQPRLQSGRIRIYQVRDDESVHTRITTLPPKRNRSAEIRFENVVPEVFVQPFDNIGDTTSNNTVPHQTPPQNSPDKRLGDCPICMDSLLNNPIASTICGHVFCMRCIKAAVAANGKKCPNCRMKFKGVGYHQLFL